MNTLEKTLLGGVLSLMTIFLGFIASFVSAPQPKTLGSSVLNIPVYSNTQITTSPTTTIAAYPGVLHSVTFNAPVSNSVVTVYDSATTTTPTTILETITIPSSSAQTPFTLVYDGNFTKGLTVVQTGASSTFTVNYQQN